MHYALSGFGGGISVALRAALHALVGGFLAAYSSTLANRLGALARLAAAAGLTLWDQLQEKRRQAVFVYHTGRLFERMDTQMQAWHLDQWVSASAAAAEGVGASVAEWYAGTSAVVGAAVSGGWNATVASTAGALLPVGASLTAALAKVDNVTGMSHGLGVGAHGVAQGFDAVGKGFAGAGEAFALLQRDVRDWASTIGGRNGSNASNATDAAAAAEPMEGDVGAPPGGGLKLAGQGLALDAQPQPGIRSVEPQRGQSSRQPMEQQRLQVEPPPAPPPQRSSPHAPARFVDAAAAADTATRGRLALLSLFSFAMSDRMSSPSP